VIDSHVHFWDPERFDYEWLKGAGVLNRTFLPSDLAAEAPELEGLVFVQADCANSLAEAKWLHELAEEGAPVLAVVARAPLERGTQSARDIAALAELPLVTGVRRMTQDEPAGFALQPDFAEGVRLLAAHGFTMDLCIREWQFADIIQLVDACPEASFVLDHLGKPTIATESLADWAANLHRLASYSNVKVKLSGIASEASDAMRTAEKLSPWLKVGVEAFGPERCMYGSDWPVVWKDGGYMAWLEIVQSSISDLSQTEISGIMGGNALATYSPAARDERRAQWQAEHG
jgi:L-fuconolactonase